MSAYTHTHTNGQTNFIQTDSRHEEEEEEEEKGTFLKERAGRAGGRSLTWWWKASKCIDRCCPTGGDTAGLTERNSHTLTHISDQRGRGGGRRGKGERRSESGEQEGRGRWVGLKQEKGGVGAVCGGGEVFSSDSI